MIFGKTKLELKVGIFVFIGLIILAVFVLMVGKFRTWSSGYSVYTVFNFVNGVKVGAPVRFAGVDVGEVKHLDVYFSAEENRTKVKIENWVNKHVVIPQDSVVWVNTLGLLGEKYIEIMPGKDYSKVIAENGTLKGTDPIPMNEVGDIAKKLVSDIDDTVLKVKDAEGTIGRLLYDDTVYKEIEAMILDIRQNPWKLLWKGKAKR